MSMESFSDVEIYQNTFKKTKLHSQINWMGGWMDGWIDVWMDEFMYEKEQK